VLPSRWQAEYYANAFLGGRPALVRHDDQVNFDWGEGSPGEGVPADAFSARWTGELWLPAGKYQYWLTADDGARLSIDGQVVLDGWELPPGQFASTEIYLPEGVHSFQVIYYELVLTARIQLGGEVVSSLTSGSDPDGFWLGSKLGRGPGRDEFGIYHKPCYNARP
jgi:hypothetical protein